MARDNIPSDMGKYNKKNDKGTSESTRKKPHFAEKSYKERATEAYNKYLGSLKQD